MTPEERARAITFPSSKRGADFAEHLRVKIANAIRAAVAEENGNLLRVARAGRAFFAAVDAHDTWLVDDDAPLVIGGDLEQAIADTARELRAALAALESEAPS